MRAIYSLVLPRAKSRLFVAEPVLRADWRMVLVAPSEQRQW
jgi:hypothetical protein